MVFSSSGQSKMVWYLIRLSIHGTVSSDDVVRLSCITKCISKHFKSIGAIVVNWKPTAVSPFTSGHGWSEKVVWQK